MGIISWTRVLLGGLVAGLVLNVFLLGPGLGATHLSLGRAPREAITIAVIMALLIFLLTILVTWLYAAMRSRFGPGLKTALMAGTASGLLLGLFQYAGWIMTSKIMPAKVVAASSSITLVALVIATLIGARVYEKPSSERSSQTLP
jgi:cation transporter-like permease